jgi:hypothetical protein
MQRDDGDVFTIWNVVFNQDGPEATGEWAYIWNIQSPLP